MTDLQKHGQELLEEAIEKLWEAMIELTRPTSPQTPLPRVPAKPIRIVRKLELSVWINREGRASVYFCANGQCVLRWEAISGTISAFDKSRLLKDSVREMMPHLSHPRALANCLRQLRWLTAWMRKRAEGRRRAAEEILRQQRKWIEMLEGEIAMRGLAK
jgi:hypothetical protein